MSQIAIPITALLWSGMTLGISLESWVKFKTPSLMKPVGLDVGRTVFSAFHKAQFILLIILIVSGLIASLPMELACRRFNSAHSSTAKCLDISHSEQHH
jgi:hypothetical protein